MNLGVLVIAALPFVISPGASFSITVGAIAQGERRVPLRVWAGTSLGIALIATVAGVSGLGRFIAGDDTARTVFGLVGGIVLIGFGVTAIIRGLRPTAARESVEPSNRRLILWSFLVVISNIKALSLYALVVPPLTSAVPNAWQLYPTFAAVHIVLLLGWLLVIGFSMKAIPALVESDTARKTMVFIAAVMLVGLGVMSTVGALR